MRMTKKQIEYAEKRIDGIFMERKKKIISKHTVKGKKLDVKERIAKLILLLDSAGLFYKKDNDWAVRSFVVDSVDWSSMEVADKVDKEAMNIEIGKLESEKKEIMDKLYLGDGSEALEMIKELEDSV